MQRRKLISKIFAGIFLATSIYYVGFHFDNIKLEKVYVDKISYINEGNNVQRLAFFKISGDDSLHGEILDKKSFDTIQINKKFEVSNAGEKIAVVISCLLGALFFLFVGRTDFDGEEPKQGES